MNEALKARFSVSIPNMTLVEIDAVSAQQFAVLFLKRAGAMVLLLCLDVLQHGLKLAGAHRKRAIAALPEKGTILRSSALIHFEEAFFICSTS